MTHLVKVISSAIIYYEIANEDERELYEYSILILLEQASVWASILFVACLFGVLWETMFYIVLFVPIRIYAGGYHARTFARCYFFSVATFLAFALIQHYFNFSASLILLAILLSATIILIFAPIEDANKPMTRGDKLVYTKFARVILLCELAVTGLMFVINYQRVWPFICFAFLHSAVLLLVGKCALINKVYRLN